MALDTSKNTDSGDEISLKPSQKVAALLIILGPKTASEVLRNISDENLLEQITLDIANLNKVPNEKLSTILDEFRTVFKANSLVSSGGVDYAKKILESAYGKEEANRMFDRLTSLINTNPFFFLNEADPSQLATTFQNENPQLLALVMAYLRPELAAQVMASLPSDIQSLVSMKIAEMNTTNPEILSEIEDVVEKKFSALVVHDFSKAGGVQALANILNYCDRATEKNIMECLDIENQEMAQEVRDLMFVFEDIINLDDKAVQRVLREVEGKDLATALKGVKDELKEKIFQNMSERAHLMLKDDMDYLGPVRAKEVQEAQTKIVTTIRTLEMSGEIVISRASAEDEFIE
ncbi:flagellar motor switch protein FliG [bacterium]|nr:flagellar motor switch protein FliG [bacterium]